ncbi:hypothetical protein R6Q59_018584 [Mikania micrantha]
MKSYSREAEHLGWPVSTTNSFRRLQPILKNYFNGGGCQLTHTRTHNNSIAVLITSSSPSAARIRTSSSNHKVQMDNLYGISNSKVPKYSSLSPLHNFALLNPYCHHLGHVVDQCLSHDVHNSALKKLNSPNRRYLQSGSSHLASPSSVLEQQPYVGYMYHHHGSGNRVVGSRKESPRQSKSPLHFSNSVKVEEDVVVFDGVLVNDLPAADRPRSSSLSLTDSGGSSFSGGKSNKTDLCLSYLENSGFCCYGTKCQQFTHGNQEQHPATFSNKSLLKTPCKNNSLSGTSLYGSKCRFLHHETSPPTSSTTRPTSQIKPHGPPSSIAKLKSCNWSPMDDIEIQFKQDFDSFINKVLYGPRRIKRLTAFTHICQE